MHIYSFYNDFSTTPQLMQLMRSVSNSCISETLLQFACVILERILNGGFILRKSAIRPWRACSIAVPLVLFKMFIKY